MKRSNTMKMVKLVGVFKSEEEAGASASIEEAAASASTEEVGASASTEEVDASEFTEETDLIAFLKQAGVSSPIIKQAEAHARRKAKKLEEQAMASSEQPGVLPVRRLFKGFPRLSLPAYVDFGKLFSIALKNMEFRGIIRLLLLLNNAMHCLRKTEQVIVVQAVLKIEEYIDELVELADSPYNDPKEIDELFRRLGCQLDYICTKLQKCKAQTYSPFLVFGFDVFPSQKRPLALHEKDVEVDANFLGGSQTSLRMRLDIKYLGEISRDHPEFGPTIKTVFGVYVAMKYLTYDKQVEVFRNLLSLQETIKELLLYKTYLNVDSFERYVPTLISKVSSSFSDLLDTLSKKIAPPRKSRMVPCKPCKKVSELVKKVEIEPEPLEREPFNLEEAIRKSADYANFGIGQENFGSLESFFHHLTAKEGVDFEHILKGSRISWTEIAHKYKQYRTGAIKDLALLSTLKEHISWRLVEAEEIMAEARTFCDRIRDIPFSGNETLSDTIALGGELELLTSEAEEYVLSLEDLVEQFTKDWPEYEKVSKRIRRGRSSFLTQHRFVSW